MKFPFALVVALATVGHVSSFSPLPRHVQAPHLTSSLSTPFSNKENKVWAQPLPSENEDLVGMEGETNVQAPLRKSTNTKSVMEIFTADLFSNTKAKQAAMAAVLMLASAPLPSNAAMSGGRMGGSYSSRPARVQTMPRSTYSGGYGSGYSRGYGQSLGGFSSGYATGLGAGYMSAPRMGFSPFVSPIYPRSYGGAGVISYNAGPNLGQLVFFGGLALAISTALQKQTVDWSLPPSTLDLDGTTSALGSGTSYVKISVAVDVPNRDDPSSILSVLNRLGRTANTDNRKGIQNLTSQVALEVLRRKSSIVSASTEYQHFRSRSQALREFNNQATKERSKFERENTRLFDHDQQERGSKATMAVVTLILSIDGDSTKVPRIGSLQDVEESLRNIASDSKMDDCLQSVEILWTPEERSETLLFKDVIADYPTLRSV